MWYLYLYNHSMSNAWKLWAAESGTAPNVRYRCSGNIYRSRTPGQLNLMEQETSLSLWMDIWKHPKYETWGLPLNKQHEEWCAMNLPLTHPNLQTHHAKSARSPILQVGRAAQGHKWQSRDFKAQHTLLLGPQRMPTLVSDKLFKKLL